MTLQNSFCEKSYKQSKHYRRRNKQKTAQDKHNKEKSFYRPQYKDRRLQQWIIALPARSTRNFRNILEPKLGAPSETGLAVNDCVMKTVSEIVYQHVVKSRNSVLQHGQEAHEPTEPPETGIRVPARSAKAQAVTEVIAVKHTTSRLDEGRRDVKRRQINQALHKVTADDS